MMSVRFVVCCVLRFSECWLYMLLLVVCVLCWWLVLVVCWLIFFLLFNARGVLLIACFVCWWLVVVCSLRVAIVV